MSSPLENALIIIDGPFASGKTSFVNTAHDHLLPDGEWIFQPSWENHNDSYWWVGMKFQLEPDLPLMLCEIPATLNPRGREKYHTHIFVPRARSILGVIIVFDGRKRYSISIKQLHWIASEDYRASLPAIIAVNRLSDPDAWTFDEVREFLTKELLSQMDPMPPIVPCHAENPAEVRTTLVTFLEYCEQWYR